MLLCFTIAIKKHYFRFHRQMIAGNIFSKLATKVTRDYQFETKCKLIVLGFNDMSTLVGHLMLSPREKEKRDRRDSRGDGRGTMKKEEQE